MKLIMLGISCILFGIAMLFLEVILFTDEIIFESLAVGAPFLGIIFAFAGTFMSDKNN